MKPKTTQAERHKLLERLFNANLRALVEQLEDSPKEVPAALLNVSRQMLADNGVSHDTLSEEERSREGAKAIAKEIGEIPEFPQFYE